MTDTLQFELVTPEQLAISEQVAMVEIPGEEGDFGVLPGHAPFMSMIRPGVITVHEVDAKLKKIFVSGGYAEVNPEGCIVLAEHVRDLAGLDKAAVQLELDTARRDLDHAEDEAGKILAGKKLRAAEALVSALS